MKKARLLEIIKEEIQSILNEGLSVNEGNLDAPDWWYAMSKTKQQAYLKKHPTSDMAVYRVGGEKSDPNQDKIQARQDKIKDNDRKIEKWSKKLKSLEEKGLGNVTQATTVRHNIQGLEMKNSKHHSAIKKLKHKTESIGEGAERDYKDEYKKFQSSSQKKKYRAELNKYNRNKGTYGNGDGKDASHKGGKIVGFEAESKNRGRSEKSRLKKEFIKEAENLGFNDIKVGYKVIVKTPHGQATGTAMIWNKKYKSWVLDGTNVQANEKNIVSIKRGKAPKGAGVFGRRSWDETITELTVPEKHQKKIAIQTLKYSDAGAKIMGGMTKERAREFLKKIGYSDKRIAKLEESINITEVNMKKSELQRIIKEEIQYMIHEAKSDVKIGKYSLGMGEMGNGMVIWNSNKEEHGDYQKVAHISDDKTLKIYIKNPPPALKSFLTKLAKKYKPTYGGISQQSGWNPKESTMKEESGVSIFDINSVEKDVKNIKKAIQSKTKAPLVVAKYSKLGGDDRISILITIGLDPKETWANGIFENSRFTRFHLYRDGTLEQFTNFAFWNEHGKFEAAKKFRKSRVKDLNGAIKKINDYVISNQNTLSKVRGAK